MYQPIRLRDQSTAGKESEYGRACDYSDRSVAAIFLGTIMVRPFARITRSIGDLQDGYDADYLHVYTYKETTLIQMHLTRCLED